MRLLEPVLTLLLYVLLQPVKLALSLAIGKARKAVETMPPVTEILDHHETTAHVPTCTRIPADLEADFLLHRSPAYLEPMVLGTAREAARALLGTIGPEDPTPEALAKTALGSATAWRTRRDDERGVWVCDLSPMQHHRFFVPHAAEVDRFEFDLDRGHFVIFDRDGRGIRAGDPRWQGALRKATAQVSVHVPAGAHSWVHFWVPDVVAARVWTTLPRDTNLFRLLAPHVRFNCRINMQALWVQKSTDNEPSGAKGLVPWLSFPIYKDDFRALVARDVAEHYERYPHLPDLANALDTRIPYFAYLKAYYDEIRAFVDAIAPHLERDVWERFAKDVDPLYPGFSDGGMEETLARFIWQVGVVHLSDHHSYLPFARRYGFSALGMTIDDLGRQRPPRYNAYRFRCFLNVFVQFHPATTGLDQRMLNVAAYGFPHGSELNAQALRFADRLRAVDERLAKEGLQILPVDELIQSVCF
jgi:hypothetical protein